MKSWYKKSKTNLVIVVFSTAWSGSTHILNTYIKALCEEIPLAISFSVDIEKQRDLVSELDINQIPTTFFIHNETVVAYHEGAISKKNLRQKIESLIADEQ